MAATPKVKPVPEVMTEMKKETVIRTMQKDIDSLRGHIAKESVIKEVRKAPQEKITIEEKVIKEDKKPVTQKRSVGLPKLIALALIVILILGGLGGFLYWRNYSVEVEEPTEPTEPTEPDIPQSLIPTSGTELIVLEAGYKDAFIQELKLILAKEKEEGALDSILIKITSQTEIRYASLSDFISFLGINLPTEIIQSNYTFFSYRQPEGARLGLVIQLKEGADLSETLNLWETNIQEDLKALFIGLNEQDVLTAATEEFQDNTYNEIAIRYLNFPSSDLSIDYAVVDDKLIIATSKESMYAAIDALTPIKYE